MNIYPIFEALAVKMTVITLFVIVLKQLFKNRLSARLHCMIWLLPCIQLLFCIGDIQIQTASSIYGAMPDIAVTESSFNFKSIIPAIWISGAAVFALWHISTYILYLRRVRALPEISNLPALAELRTRLNIHRKITLRRGRAAQTVSDTIILPEDFSADEEYHILLHELCHFKHMDNLKLWTALTVLCVNWFNPIMWIGFRFFRTDIEMLCDERVLQITQNRREYAEVLIKSSIIHQRFIPGAVSASSGRREVFARVRRIVKFSRMKPLWILTAVVGCCAAALLCLTVPREMEQLAEEAVASPTPEILVLEPVSPRNEGMIIDITTPEPVVIQNPTAAPRPQTQQNSTPRRQSTQSATQSTNTSRSTETVTYDTPEITSRESISGNGSKETYVLEDGSRAVVQYDDGEVANRYIIVD